MSYGLAFTPFTGQTLEVLTSEIFEHISKYDKESPDYKLVCRVAGSTDLNVAAAKQAEIMLEFKSKHMDELNMHIDAITTSLAKLRTLRQSSTHK